MSNSPIIDPQAIENLRSLNPDDNDEFLREIAGIFFEDTPQRIAELQQCLAATDVSRFTRAAHSIKGSSSNLGANLLRGAAERLEMHSKAQGLTGVEPMIAEVQNRYDEAARELRTLLKLA